MANLTWRRPARRRIARSAFAPQGVPRLAEFTLVPNQPAGTRTLECRVTAGDADPAKIAAATVSVSAAATAAVAWRGRTRRNAIPRPGGRQIENRPGHAGG